MAANAHRAPLVRERRSIAASLSRLRIAIEPWYDWGRHKTWSLELLSDNMAGPFGDETTGEVRFFTLQWFGLHLQIEVGRTPKRRADAPQTSWRVAADALSAADSSDDYSDEGIALAGRCFEQVMSARPSSLIELREKLSIAGSNDEINRWFLEELFRDLDAIAAATPPLSPLSPAGRHVRIKRQQAWDAAVGAWRTAKADEGAFDTHIWSPANDVRDAGGDSVPTAVEQEMERLQDRRREVEEAMLDTPVPTLADLLTKIEAWRERWDGFEWGDEQWAPVLADLTRFAGRDGARTQAMENAA